MNELLDFPEFSILVVYQVRKDKMNAGGGFGQEKAENAAELSQGKDEILPFRVQHLPLRILP